MAKSQDRDRDKILKMERSMDETGFRQFLKKFGKKDHVIEGLINQVRAFESYLAGGQQKSLDAADKKDLQDYVKALPQGEGKIRIRGLGLYYGFAGNSPLARAANDFREREIAKTRPAFKLRGFRGVRLKEVAKLETVGIVTVEHMLDAGKTPKARRRLSKRTGIALPHILELVKLSDISRVGAVKSVRARLYYDAGLDTPGKFTRWEPEAMRKYLVGWVKRTGFDGIAPLPKELRGAISNAKKLPEVVQY